MGKTPEADITVMFIQRNRKLKTNRTLLKAKCSLTVKLRKKKRHKMQKLISKPCNKMYQLRASLSKNEEMDV
jgi:hypothetical protein